MNNRTNIPTSTHWGDYQGGIGNQSERDQLKRWRDAGMDVICVSPVRDNVADFPEADWWPVRPNSDVALMLGLAHTLHTKICMTTISCTLTVWGTTSSRTT